MSDATMDERRAAAEVADHIRRMFDGFCAHSAEGVEAALHEDCTVWDVFLPQLIHGKANRLKYHAADQAQSQARGPLTLTVDEPVTSVWGDTALARYYLRFDYAPPNPTSGVVRITSVLRRENGRWSIVHHHEGMVPGGVPPIRD
jgi:ketosteroid isomerase-like protein